MHVIFAFACSYFLLVSSATPENGPGNSAVPAPLTITVEPPTRTPQKLPYSRAHRERASKRRSDASKSSATDSNASNNDTPADQSAPALLTIAVEPPSQTPPKLPYSKAHQRRVSERRSDTGKSSTTATNNNGTSDSSPILTRRTSLTIRERRRQLLEKNNAAAEQKSPSPTARASRTSTRRKSPKKDSP